MSRRETKERDILYRACRDKRQDKMESSARHKAWALLQEKIAQPTPETRRSLLAAKLHLAALKQRAARNWT